MPPNGRGGKQKTLNGKKMSTANPGGHGASSPHHHRFATTKYSTGSNLNTLQHPSVSTAPAGNQKTKQQKLAAAYNSNRIGGLKYANQSTFFNPNNGSKLTENKQHGNASSNTHKRSKNMTVTGSMGPGLFSPQNVPSNSFGFGGIIMSPQNQKNGQMIMNPKNQTMYTIDSTTYAPQIHTGNFSNQLI